MLSILLLHTALFCKLAQVGRSEYQVHSNICNRWHVSRPPAEIWYQPWHILIKKYQASSELLASCYPSRWNLKRPLTAYICYQQCSMQGWWPTQKLPTNILWVRPVAWLPRLMPSCGFIALLQSLWLASHVLHKPVSTTFWLQRGRTSTAIGASN